MTSPVAGAWEVLAWWLSPTALWPMFMSGSGSGGGGVPAGGPCARVVTDLDRQATGPAGRPEPGWPADCPGPAARRARTRPALVSRPGPRAGCAGADAHAVAPTPICLLLSGVKSALFSCAGILLSQGERGPWQQGVRVKGWGSDGRMGDGFPRVKLPFRVGGRAAGQARASKDADMTERPSESPRERRSGIPRDMPDQQAGSAKTPGQWYADEPPPEAAEWEQPEREGVPGEGGEELPDTDEAGTGPRGKPQPGGARPPPRPAMSPCCPGSASPGTPLPRR
jgi:hypothetical protein